MRRTSALTAHRTQGVYMPVDIAHVPKLPNTGLHEKSHKKIRTRPEVGRCKRDSRPAALGCINLGRYLPGRIHDGCKGPSAIPIGAILRDYRLLYLSHHLRCQRNLV